MIKDIFMKKRILHVIIVLVIVAGIYFAVQKGTTMVSNLTAGSDKTTVVIDPGHGGGQLRK